MQITKKKNKKKYLIIACVIALLGLGAYAAYYYFYSSRTQEKSAPTTNDPSKPLSTKSDTEQKEDLQKNPEIKDSSPNTDQPAPTTKDTVSGKNKVQMIASTDTSNQTVYIRGGVNSPVPEEGTCYAQLKGPAGKSLRKNTTTLQNPASTDCKTISIPTSELVSGRWTFTLHFTSSKYEGASSEIAFTI